MSIKHKVMASVALIYAARTLLSATALKFYALLASVWGIGKLVWVSKVFENFFVVEKSGIIAVGNFIISAFAHAHTGVQLFLAVAVIAVMLLAVDVLRAATRGARFAA